MENDILIVCCTIILNIFIIIIIGCPILNYIIMYVMIKANIAQFCGLVKIIVGVWVWLSH